MSLIQHIYKISDYNYSCGMNRRVFDRLKEDFPALEVRDLSDKTEEAKALISKHDLRIFPATIVNGSLFSIGKVDEEKLRSLLKEKES